MKRRGSYVELRTNLGNVITVTPLSEADVMRVAELIADIAREQPGECAPDPDEDD